MILLIDNYDSFTYNLWRYLTRLEQEVIVLRNDAPDIDSVIQKCDALVISPGPCTPQKAGRCLELIRQWSGSMPILGICLGHQAIFEAFGGRIGRAQRPIHGQCLPVQLTDCPLFRNLRSGEPFARYHSLIAVADTQPDCLECIARSEQGEIMAVRHRHHQTFGLQFHPESVLSPAGYQVLQNFLALVGLESSLDPLPEPDWRGTVLTVQPPRRDGPSDSGDLTVPLPLRSNHEGLHHG